MNYDECPNCGEIDFIASCLNCGYEDTDMWIALYGTYGVDYGAKQCRCKKWLPYDATKCWTCGYTFPICVV